MKPSAAIFLLVIALVTSQQIPNYVQVGANFIQLYYSTFDNAVTRQQNIRNLYSSSSNLAYGGVVISGVENIVQRFETVPNVIQRNISSTDSQPTNDAGVIINVFGKLLTGDVNAPGSSVFFTEMFFIKPKVTSFVIQNQQFRQSAGNVTSAVADSLHFV